MLNLRLPSGALCFHLAHILKPGSSKQQPKVFRQTVLWGRGVVGRLELCISLPSFVSQRGSQPLIWRVEEALAVDPGG